MNQSATSDIPSIAFYLFLAVLSFLYIFNIEPIHGLILNSFVITFLTICLSYPIALILGLKYKEIVQVLKEKKSNYIVLFLLIIFILTTAFLSTFFLFKMQQSIWLFIAALLQILFFIRNDIFGNQSRKLTTSMLFLFIGIIFGWGIFNLFRFARPILEYGGIALPLGNPILGVWGMIYYSFNVIWLVDKQNRITNYLFEKRLYLWILAGIMFLFIILGGSKQHL